MPSYKREILAKTNGTPHGHCCEPVQKQKLSELFTSYHQAGILTWKSTCRSN